MDTSRFVDGGADVLTKLSWWSRIFRLAIPFRYETAELSLGWIVNSIEAMDQPKRSLFREKGFTTSVSRSHRDEQVCSFTIAYRDRMGGFQAYGTARLNGRLILDEETGTIVAEGTTQVGTDLFIIAAFFTLAFAVPVVLNLNSHFFVPMLFSAIWINAIIQLALLARRGKQQLIMAMRSIFEPAMPHLIKRKRSLLDDDVERTRLIDLNDPHEVADEERKVDHKGR